MHSQAKYSNTHACFARSCLMLPCSDVDCTSYACAHMRGRIAVPTCPLPQIADEFQTTHGFTHTLVLSVMQPCYWPEQKPRRAPRASTRLRACSRTCESLCSVCVLCVLRVEYRFLVSSFRSRLTAIQLCFPSHYSSCFGVGVLATRARGRAAGTCCYTLLLRSLNFPYLLFRVVCTEHAL